MKKVLLLTMCTLCCVTLVFAKIRKIKVSNNQFTPATVNAVKGDTIRWIWQEGNHTTTSMQIPDGAKAWDELINQNDQKFTYVLKKKGTYQYHCRFHSGMTGTIKVTASLGLNEFSVTEGQANEALLNWKMLPEHQIMYFSVQRSTDGKNFTEIARLNASSQLAYSYTDNTKTDAKYVYYQIEAKDASGETQLSDIQMSVRSDVQAVKLITNISPNPVSSPGHLMMQFNADNEGRLMVQLFNSKGDMVKQTEMTAAKGLNNGHFHLGELTPGTYYLVCTLGNLTERHTIIYK